MLSDYIVMSEIWTDLMSKTLVSPTQASELGQLKWIPEFKNHTDHGPCKLVSSSLHSKPTKNHHDQMFFSPEKTKLGQFSFRAQNILIPSLLEQCHSLEDISLGSSRNKHLASLNHFLLLK